MSDSPVKDLSSHTPATKVGGMRVSNPVPHVAKEKVVDPAEEKRLKDKADLDARSVRVQGDELDFMHSGHSKEEIFGNDTKIIASNYHPPTHNQHVTNDVRGQFNRSQGNVNQPGGKQGHDKGGRAH